MSKKRKDDFKKLALMGITGGIMVAAQAPVEAFEINSFSSNMLVAKCGNSCGNTAYNDRGYQGGSSCGSRGNYNNSCGGRSSPNSGNGSSHGCGSIASSCGGRSSPNGCGGKSSPNSCGSVASSCGGRSSPNSCGGKSSPNSCGSVASSCGSRSSPNSCGGRSQNNSYFTAENEPENKLDDSELNQDNNDQKSLSEQEVKAKLSPQGQADYDKLSAEGKAKVLKMLSHSCAGKNDCKGQNACRTTNNDCAGNGGCKGQSKCKTNPEQAVKAASMQEKRSSLNTRNTYSPR